MATDKQVQANRANAQKSTGPRTATGKKASSGNAVTHGLTAEVHLVPGEDPQAFADLSAKVVAHYKPVVVFEVELANRLTSLLWRLRRLPAFEGAVLGWLGQGQGQSVGQALEVAFAKNFFDKISRYEASLTKQLILTEGRLVGQVNARVQAEALEEVAAKPPQKPAAAPPGSQITWPGRP